VTVTKGVTATSSGFPLAREWQNKKAGLNRPAFFVEKIS